MMTYDPQTYALGTIQTSPYAGMQPPGINPLAFVQHQTGGLQGYAGGISPYGTIHPQQQLALLSAQNPLLAAALHAQLTGGVQHPILTAIQNPLLAAQNPLLAAAYSIRCLRPPRCRAIPGCRTASSRPSLHTARSRPSALRRSGRSAFRRSARSDIRSLRKR